MSKSITISCPSFKDELLIDSPEFHEHVVGLINSESYVELVETCQDILNINPRNTLVQKVAFSLINLHQFNHVCRISEIYLSLNPDHHLLPIFINECLKYGEYRTAIQLCLLYVFSNPQKKADLIRQIVFESLVNDENCEELSRLIQIHLKIEGEIDFYVGLVFKMVELRYLDLAVNLISLLIVSGYDDEKFFIDVMYVFNEIGETNRIQDFSNEILIRNPHSPELWAVIGYTFTKSNMYQHALNAFRNALQFNPSENIELKSRIFSFLSLNFLLSGNYRKAITAGKKAEMLNPESDLPYTYLGYALYLMNETKKAILTAISESQQDKKLNAG